MMKMLKIKMVLTAIVVLSFGIASGFAQSNKITEADTDKDRDVVFDGPEAQVVRFKPQAESSEKRIEFSGPEAKAVKLPTGRNEETEKKRVVFKGPAPQSIKPKD